MNSPTISFSPRESVQLVHAGVCADDIPLSVLDQEYGVQVTCRAYAWTRTLDAELLRRSLRRLLRCLPQFAGRLVTGRDGSPRIVCADQGAEFSVVRARGRMPDFDVEHSGAKRLPEWAGRLNGWVTARTPLLRVRITQYEGGGTILGVAIPHALADAGSISRLLHMWARIHRGEPCESPDVDRRALIEFEREAAGGLSRSPLQLARAELRSAKFTARVIANIRPFVSGVFELDERGLAPVLAAGDAKLAQDLVSAHIWRTLTARERRPTFELTSVLNLRSRLAPLLSLDYFGNAVGHAVCRLERAELHGGTLLEVAEAIRAARRKLDNQTVKAEHAAHCLDWKRGTGMMLRDRTTHASLQGGVCFNSEVGSPLYDVDFGAGRPAWIVRPNFPIPGLGLWSPGPTPGSFHLRVTLSPEQMRWLASSEGRRALSPGH
ncbi:acyltransferase [Nannocystaceae bacterium ST9]